MKQAICQCGAECSYQGDTGEDIEEWKCSECTALYIIYNAPDNDRLPEGFLEKPPMIVCEECEGQSFRIIDWKTRFDFTCTMCFNTMSEHRNNEHQH